MALPRKILVGVQFYPEAVLTPGSRTAVEQGVAIARASKGSLTLLHANVADEFWDAESDRLACVEATTRSQCEAALEGILDAVPFHEVPVRISVAQERADHAIIREVLKEDIELVVVGCRSRTDAHALPIGSVSRRLVHHCPCLVWVVKSEIERLPRSVLVGTDLSPVGTRAIETALSVARASNAKLHVAHAFQLPFDVQRAGGSSVSRYERGARDAARDSIAKTLEQLGGYPRARIHVARTSPAALLLEAERRFEIELTVLGTVSRGGLPGLILGNTAERLLDRLRNSILAVKPADFVCALDA